MSHLSSRSEEHLQIAQKCINETIANIGMLNIDKVTILDIKDN